MADNPEMVVVDPDAPSDVSVKQSLMTLPTWEEWLKEHGFIKGERPRGRTINVDDWNRYFPKFGRGWLVRVAPAADTINIIVYSNTLGQRHSQHVAMVSVAESAVTRIVSKLIAEIERPVSDATKKRRIRAFTSAIPYEERDEKIEFINGPVLPFTEARPIRRPIPDDPAQLNKEQMDQMLDRVQVRCFQKGQRVRVLQSQSIRLNGLMGTVVDASPHACYVALDSFVAAGDPDPFRFAEDEVVPVYENQKAFDPDDPAPYLAALDYITPLKKLGYQALRNDYFTKHIQFNHEKQGMLSIGLKPMPNAHSSLTVVIFIDYYQGGESERIADMALESMDVVDRVRELEALAGSVPNIAEFARKLKETDYHDSTVFSHYDHLLHLFGESVLEGIDDPEPYIQELGRHADLINLFRERRVRMGRRMSQDRPYYRMFWIPSAVTDVSYDIFLTPKPDGSWSIEAEGNKEFQDQVGVDWQEEFDIEQEWQIPAGTPVSEMKLLVDDILSDLLRHKGPDEPTIEERDVDDLDEGIDDPDATTLTQERTDLFKQEGYVYKADYKGNPHWEKKWPLPLPIKTGKVTLTDLMIHPGHGQIWYSLVDAAGRPKGGWSIRLPGGDTPYTTSLRRALLKMRHVAERMPVDANFNDMFSYLRVAFDKVQDAVESESRQVCENEDDIDYEQYVKTSANYNPVQLLSAADVRKIIKDTGYRINSLYHSKRTTGYSLRIAPGTPEQLAAMKENPEREANRMLAQVRQGIIKRLPMLGKIERGMYNLDDKLMVHCWHWGPEPRYGTTPDDPRNFLLYVDILPEDYQRRGPMGKMLPEGLDDPEGYVNKLARAQYCPRCLSHDTECIGVHRRLPGGYGNGQPQEFWKCNTCGDKFLWSDDRSVGFKLESAPYDPDKIEDLSAYLKSTRDPITVLKEFGYEYGPDSNGKLRWQKFWPLPHPVQRYIQPWAGSWTHLWASPDPWGQLVYALVQKGPDSFKNRADGGYIIVAPVKRAASVEDTDYTTSVRRMLLKVEALARDIPAEANDGDALRGYVFQGMERIKNEVNTEAVPTWDEPPVTESVADPVDDIDPEKYAKETLIPDKTLLELGYTFDSKPSGQYWYKIIGDAQLVIWPRKDTLEFNMQAYSYEDGIWVCRGNGSGYPLRKLKENLILWEKRLREGVLFTKEPGAMVKLTQEGIDDPEDMLKRVRMPKMGEIVKVICPYCGHSHESIKNWPDDAPKEWGFACPSCARHIPLTNLVIESDEDIDPAAYAKTTYDPVAFLTEQGWAYHSTAHQEYYAKSFSMPMPYRLGGMTFTTVQVCIGIPRSLHLSSWVLVYFVDADGNRMPVQGYTLHSQQLYGWEGEDEAPDNFHDINMPIRRFALSIENVLRNVEWPDQPEASVLASSRVQYAVDMLVKSLNKQAHAPLNPEIRESVDEPAPESMLQQLPQQTYVTFTRSLEEDQEIAEGNFPGVPLEQALTQQLLRELEEAKLFDMSTIKVSGIEINGDAYIIRLVFSGYDSDVALRNRLQDAYREVGVGGDFNIEQFRHEPTSSNQWIAKGWEPPVEEALDPDDRKPSSKAIRASPTVRRATSARWFLSPGRARIRATGRRTLDVLCAGRINAGM